MNPMLDFGGIGGGSSDAPALFKFVERGLATRSPATFTSVTPGVAMLCHQRVDDAWRALCPPNVTHARRAFTNAVEVKGGPPAKMRPRERPPNALTLHAPPSAPRYNLKNI